MLLYVVFFVSFFSSIVKSTILNDGLSIIRLIMPNSIARMCDSLVVGMFPSKTKTRHKFYGVCVVSVMHWGGIGR